MGSQSTVFAGGRYDGLVEYFGGPEKMSGIGWAMGMERLIIACEAEGIDLSDEQASAEKRFQTKVSTLFGTARQSLLLLHG